MDMTYGDLGGSLTTGMVATAAIASALPAQSAVLRGSQASLSLAADLQNQVFQAFEQIEEEAAHSESTGGAGGKAMEVIAVQALAAFVPMIFKGFANAAERGCGKRKVTTEEKPNKTTTPKRSPKFPRSKTSTPGVSPIAPEHFQMSAGSSAGELSEDVDGVGVNSLDLGDSSTNTVQRRERANGVLLKL